MKKKKIDIIDVQREFIVQKRKEEATPKVKCPQHCDGRIKNQGHCTIDNCVILIKRKPIAMKSLYITTGGKKAGRKYVPRLARRDKKLLLEIGSYGKVPVSSFYYRTITREQVREQLKALGRPMPRLTRRTRQDVQLKVHLKEVNKVRIKMGLPPLEKLHTEEERRLREVIWWVKLNWMVCKDKPVPINLKMVLNFNSQIMRPFKEEQLMKALEYLEKNKEIKLEREAEDNKDGIHS